MWVWGAQPASSVAVGSQATTFNRLTSGWLPLSFACCVLWRLPVPALPPFSRVQIVAANGLDVSGGGPVSIIAGKVEEVEGIGHDKVGAGHMLAPRCGAGGVCRCVCVFVCGSSCTCLLIQEAGDEAHCVRAGLPAPSPLLPRRCL